MDGRLVTAGYAMFSPPRQQTPCRLVLFVHDDGLFSPVVSAVSSLVLS